MENVVLPDRDDPHGFPGKDVSRSDSVDASQSIDEYASLVSIIAPVECVSVMLQAARRIRRHIRQADTLIYLENTCALGLPVTPLRGAQSVARRIAMLLVDVDCEIQTFSGLAALALWQRLLAQHALVVNAVEPQIEPSSALSMLKQDAVSASALSLPYLAGLTSYPSRRLLHLLPYELACRYCCIPVGAERDMLTIGTTQGLDERAVQHMRDVTRRKIFQVRCEASMIEDVLRYWRSEQTVLSEYDVMEGV